jgi:hypothetical protein
MRERTVPSLMPKVAATSSYDSPSMSHSTTAARKSGESASSADSADYADKECSKLHYLADKDRLGFVVVIAGYCGFGVRLRHLRDLRETLGFSLCRYNLSTLACYFPADYADYAEGMQQAALFRRERQVVVRLFMGKLRKFA